MSQTLDNPFDLVGGRAVVEDLAARFYAIMERDEPALAALHRQASGEDAPEGAGAGAGSGDGSGSRIDPGVKSRFALFLVGWLGGPQEYMERHGHPRLRMRHAGVPVDQAMRDAWLRCMGRALDEAGVTGPVRGFLDQRFAEVASFLMNVG